MTSAPPTTFGVEEITFLITRISLCFAHGVPAHQAFFLHFRAGAGWLFPAIFGLGMGGTSPCVTFVCDILVDHLLPDVGGKITGEPLESADRVAPNPQM
jgi:hypothetical protein